MRSQLMLCATGLLVACQCPQANPSVPASRPDEAALHAPSMADAQTVDAAIGKAMLLFDDAVGDLKLPELPEMQDAGDTETALLLQSALATFDQKYRAVLENIANVNTPGYKRRAITVATELMTLASGEQLRVPVVAATLIEHSSGPLCNSGRQLDVAIDGQGMFSFALSDGSCGYSRVGHLHVDASGRLASVEGHVLLPEITLPNDLLDLAIAPDGRCCGRTSGAPDSLVQFGQIELHRFIDATALGSCGSYYQPSKASAVTVTSRPGRDGLGCLKQGFLEGSNVPLHQELMTLQVLAKQRRAIVKTLRLLGFIES